MKIDSYIKEQFGIKDVDIRTYSPLTLAYIGDGIFDIVIRSVVVGKGNTKANLLHKHTSNIVKAHTQALMIEALLPYLTEEERRYFNEKMLSYLKKDDDSSKYGGTVRETDAEVLSAGWTKG